MDFDHGMTIVEKVDLIFGWLDDCKNGPPPRFITLYLPEVDTAGHLAGPDSPEVDQALVQVDQGIGNILVGLVKKTTNQLLFRAEINANIPRHLEICPPTLL